jgi:hypothetical protein
VALKINDAAAGSRVAVVTGRGGPEACHEAAAPGSTGGGGGGEEHGCLPGLEQAHGERAAQREKTEAAQMQAEFSPIVSGAGAGKYLDGRFL